jgi:hypothetical protein
MRLTAEDIGVDAGMIMVADVSYLKTVKTRKDPTRFGKVFDVPRGTYKVSWKAGCGDIGGEHDEDSQFYDDAKTGTATLKVTSGKVFVSDPCYVIGSKRESKNPAARDYWSEWLEKTDFGKDTGTDKAFVIDVGDDGGYQVDLELEETK